MSKTILHYHAQDISALSRALRKQWADAERPPTHLELLNQLARAVGFSNFQHFRARFAVPAAEATPPIDETALKKWARYFGPDGKLSRWPAKNSHLLPCLWVVWSRLPARRNFSERGINALLQAQHGFGDHVRLRRALVDQGLLWRTADGSVYRRVEKRPTPEVLALIRRLASGH